MDVYIFCIFLHIGSWIWMDIHITCITVLKLFVWFSLSIHISSSELPNECIFYVLTPRVTCIPARLAYLLPPHGSDFLFWKDRGSCRPAAVPQETLVHGVPGTCQGYTEGSIISDCLCGFGGSSTKVRALQEWITSQTKWGAQRLEQKVMKPERGKKWINRVRRWGLPVQTAAYCDFWCSALGPLGAKENEQCPFWTAAFALFPEG